MAKSTSKIPSLNQLPPEAAATPADIPTLSNPTKDCTAPDGYITVHLLIPIAPAEHRPMLDRQIKTAFTSNTSRRAYEQIEAGLKSIAAENPLLPPPTMAHWLRDLFEQIAAQLPPPGK